MSFLIDKNRKTILCAHEYQTTAIIIIISSYLQVQLFLIDGLYPAIPLSMDYLLRSNYVEFYQYFSQLRGWWSLVFSQFL